MKDFSSKTLLSLRKKGIRVLGATYAPDASGSFANGEVVYNLDDNGTHAVRTFREVLALAE